MSNGNGKRLLNLTLMQTAHEEEEKSVSESEHEEIMKWDMEESREMSSDSSPLKDDSEEEEEKLNDLERRSKSNKSQTGKEGTWVFEARSEPLQTEWRET